MPPVRFVFDTNIYISAAISSGSYASQWLRADAGYTIYCSLPILHEIQLKLEGKFHFEHADVVTFIENLQSIITIVYPKNRLSGIVSDPKDHIILECAQESKANMIITADQDLLRLKKFGDTAIVHPSLLKYMYPETGKND
jgi:putative PIN family toxin of toxin-antitoxin system